MRVILLVLCLGSFAAAGEIVVVQSEIPSVANSPCPGGLCTVASPVPASQPARAHSHVSFQRRQPIRGFIRRGPVRGALCRVFGRCR